MKKMMMTAATILALAAGASAQKNTLLVYGDLTAASVKQPNDDKTTSFGIRPGVGYQFNDNWTAGLNLGYVRGNNETGSTEVTNRSFNVGPFLRYTQPLTGPFALFAQLNTGYINANSETKSGPLSSKAESSGFGAELFPAVGVNLKKGFALNFSFGGLSFNSVKAKGASDGTTSFGLNFGQQGHVGISKNFSLK